MATERAMIGIGVDLEILRAQMAAIPKIAAQDVGKAMREIDSLAKRTSATITKVGRAQVRASKDRERAEIRVAAILRDAEGERQTASERAVAWMDRELQKLDMLAKKGADVAKVEKARAAVRMTGAKRIADSVAPDPRAAAGFDALAAAQGRAAVSGKELGYAAQSVAQQLPDVISQLSAGAPAGQVFAQQGLQVVQVNMGLVSTAARGLLGLMAGPWGAVMGAAAAAAVLLASEIQQDRLEMQAFRDALESTERALNVSAIEGYADASRSMAAAVASAKEALYLQTGALDSLDVAQMRAVESTRESARAVLLEAAAIWARLEVQRQEIQARIASGDLNYSEIEAAYARLDVIGKELPLAQQRLQQVKDEVAASVERVNATHNEIRAAKEAADAEKDAGKARTAASKASSKAAREAARIAEDAAQRAADAFEREAQAILFLADAAQRLDAEREILSMAAAGPSAAQIGEWRDLGSAVDEMVPQAGLDRATQLVLLLDQLEYAAAQSGEASRALADDIGRVQQAITIEAAEAWIAEIEEVEQTTLDATGSITASMHRVGGAVSSLAGGAGPLGALGAAFLDADRMAERMIGRAKEAAELAGEDFGPAQAEETADRAADISKAVGRVASMAGPFLDEIAKGAKGGKAVAEMAAGFITGIAKGIGPFIGALVSHADEIALAFVKAPFYIIAGLMDGVRDIGESIASAFTGGLRREMRKIRRFFADMFREIATGGKADTRSFGDTPGPVRVDRASMTARFAGGDYVAAARSMDGLRAQVGATAAPAADPVVVLDVRDGPVQLGISRATSRAVQRSGVGRDTTGRRSPYARL